MLPFQQSDVFLNLPLFQRIPSPQYNSEKDKPCGGHKGGDIEDTVLYSLGDVVGTVADVGKKRSRNT